MGRREYVRCAEQGCREFSFQVYDTRADERDGLERQRKHPWRCPRHHRPDEVLRPDNTAIQHVLVASKVNDLPGLFWRAKGQERSGSGFTFGPGFKAYASDFPEGTRLVVTAYVETPAQAAIAAEVDAAGGE